MIKEMTENELEDELWICELQERAYVITLDRVHEEMKKIHEALEKVRHPIA